jgi:hypothetical protein
MLAGFITRAAADVLSLVPKDDEVVVGINVRQVVDSALFQQFVKVRPRARDQAAFLEKVLGINILTDVDKVYLFGKIRNEESMGVVFKGRIDQRKVLATLAAYPDNTTQTVYGLPVHGWFDIRAKKKKFCTFLPDGTVIFWNCQQTMETSLAAVNDKALSLLESPDGKIVPDETNKATAWLVMINREDRLRRLRQYEVDRMTAFVTMSAKDVQGQMQMTCKEAEDAQRWVQMMQGVILMGKSQQDNRLLQEMATRTQINLKPDGKTADLTTALDVQNVVDMITGKKSLDDEEN